MIKEKVIYPLFIFSFVLFPAFALAQNDTLHLSLKQVEEQFLGQNLQLIAEKLNIDKAEANVIQAKLWPNPNLTIDQVNLWITEDQKQGQNEVIPPLFGNFGRNMEFGVALEQLITTAGKRRKLVAMEKVSKEMSIQYFEELLLSLKSELRNSVSEFLYLQEYRNILKLQVSHLEKMIQNHQTQVEKGLVSKTQLLRLQAALLEVESELNETQKSLNEKQQNLKMLLTIPRPCVLVLENKDYNIKFSPDSLSYGSMLNLAMEKRPDVKAALLQTEYYEKSVKYEKSQRIPDLSLHAAYDRDGGVYRNFVGFGFSIDLPFFNRNQGNIKIAQINLQQSHIETQQNQLKVQTQVEKAFSDYVLSYHFYKKIPKEYISDLDTMLETYTKNFEARNVGILEYLDFLEAYRDNKRSTLGAYRDLCKSLEDLQYTLGCEL